MAVGGGGNKVAAAYARRGSFLRTGIQSGVLAGQGGKSGRQGLPTATPRSRRNGKTRQGPAGDLPNGPLRLVAEKREKAGESQVRVTKSGGQYESWGHCENLRSILMESSFGCACDAVADTTASRFLSVFSPLAWPSGSTEGRASSRRHCPGQSV